MPPSDNGLPYKYPLSDGTSCPLPDNGNGDCYCCQGVGGDLPDPGSGSGANYLGGQVIWHQAMIVPSCAV